MLLSLTLLTIAVLLGRYGHNIQVQTIEDMCSAVVMVCSGIIAITLSVTGVQQEVEQKTIYPVLAKSIERWEYITGKFFGVMGAVAIGIFLMGAALLGALAIYTGRVDPAAALVMPFVLIECGILSAVGLLLSNMALAPLAWFLTMMIYFAGSAKFGIEKTIQGGDHPTILSKIVGGAVYHILPNLECFNFKDAMVHHLQAPPLYVAQTAVYGVLYTAALLTIASYSFSRKEL